MAGYLTFLKTLFYLFGGYQTFFSKTDHFETPPIIPRKVFFNNYRSQVRLSPDGKFLAFLDQLDGVSNIFVQSLDEVLRGDASATAVTFDKDRGIYSYSWTYVSNILLYSQDIDGDENYRLYRVNASTGETLLLTNTTDAQVYIVASNRKYPELIYIGINDRDPRYHDLYKMNLITAEKELILENTQGFTSFIIDNDFNLRFTTKEAEDGGTNYFWPLNNSNSINLTIWKLYKHIKFEDSSLTGVQGFDASNTKCYWISSENSNLASLFVADFDDPSNISMIYQAKKSDVDSVLFHPLLHIPLILYEEYMRSERVYLNDSVEKDFEYLDSLDKNGEVTVLSMTLDMKKWLIGVVFDNLATKYYIYDREENGKATFMFNSRDDFDDYKLAKMNAVKVKVRDGVVEVCYLTLPIESDPLGTGHPMEPGPMVVLVHGGPNFVRDYWGYNREVQLLANRGYSVLQCNYRGSSGYGKKFANLGNGEWGRKMQHDLIDAAKWAIRNKIADPKQIAIYGGSYGGYAALAGLTFAPNFFACAVDIVGPSNLITMIETIPPYWEPYQKSEIKRVGGSPKTKKGRKFLRSRSPLFYAQRITKPLLIAQGAMDPRVKKSESDQIFEAMKKRKIPVTYLVFPDEGHGFARPENNIAFYSKVEEFLAECLGGRVEAGSADSNGTSMVIVHEGEFH